jgi:Tol biopolymer transport system component
MIDGKQIPSSAAAVHTPIFSPDSQHYAYSGSAPGSSFVVMDGNVTPVDGRVKGFYFSPDSKRFAYIVETETVDQESGKKIFKSYIVVDGKRGKEYHRVEPYNRNRDWPTNEDPNVTVFSPDSKHIAYGATLGKNTFMVLDDREIGPYRELGLGYSRVGACFSPDSTRFAYRAVNMDGKWVWLIDGTEIENVDSDNTPVFSPDSKHIAYARYNKDTRAWCVVRDDEPGNGYGQISGNSLAFSPDSQHLYYSVSKGGEEGALVMDGEEQPPPRSGILTYSPDGKHLVCQHYEKIVVKGSDALSLAVFVDGVERGPKGAWLLNFKFSPDSSHIAATMIGPKPSHPVDYDSMPPMFGIDRTIAVLLDFVPGAFYDFLGPYMAPWNAEPLFFSPDSKHLAYFGKSGTDWYVIVDGTEQVLGLVPYSPLVFDSPTKFHFIALKDWTEVMLVEVEIGE